MPSGTTPAQITSGPNGTLWYIGDSSTIGSFTAANPSPTTYLTGLTSGALPLGITSGSGGVGKPDDIWFTEAAANQIGMINPNSGTPPITYFGVSNGMTSNSEPSGIASADGYIWFTQINSNQIGRLIRTLVTSQSILCRALAVWNPISLLVRMAISGLRNSEPFWRSTRSNPAQVAAISP